MAGGECGGQLGARLPRIYRTPYTRSLSSFLTSPSCSFLLSQHPHPLMSNFALHASPSHRTLCSEPGLGTARKPGPSPVWVRRGRWDPRQLPSPGQADVTGHGDSWGSLTSRYLITRMADGLNQGSDKHRHWSHDSLRTARPSCSRTALEGVFALRFRVQFLQLLEFPSHKCTVARRYFIPFQSGPCIPNYNIFYTKGFFFF